MRELVDVWPV